MDFGRRGLYERPRGEPASVAPPEPWISEQWPCREDLISGAACWPPFVHEMPRPSCSIDRGGRTVAVARQAWGPGLLVEPRSLSVGRPAGQLGGGLGGRSGRAEEATEGSDGRCSVGSGPVITILILIWSWSETTGRPWHMAP